MKRQGIALAMVAFAVYIIGGLACFSGVALIIFMKGINLWGLGDAKTIGYLLICVGACLSVLGVLLMRIFRNRKII